MATVDTRSGFRLPWSSDRSHDDADRADRVEATPEAAGAEHDAGASTWPSSDFAARTSPAPTAVRPVEEPAMTQLVAAPTLAPHIARKPTKLMTDLAAAIRSTTESARDQALAAVAADATQVTEAIRVASTDGAQAIRRQSEEDLASIKEWSKAEIARIREQTDARIGARKATLDIELASHAAAVEHRVGEVDATVARYRADMETYFGRLASEDDPARLATMAEAMPEPPALDGLVNLSDLDISAFAPVEIAEPEAPAAWAATAELDAAIGTDDSPEVGIAAETPGETAGDAVIAWGMSDQAWLTGSVVPSVGPDADDAPDNASNRAAGDAPDALADGAEGWDSVDRSAMMAAIEAAAEVGVAAEPVTGTAAQAEAATDVTGTAAGLLVGTVDMDDGAGDAWAAASARVDAGGFETQSFTDRLASLMPGHGDDATDGPPRTTQVIVTGLVSVASIASFKRHLGRLTGVQSVAVSSGPDGEFVFNVNHGADVSFRDAIPSMPGFAARVTGNTDGVVSVTARDPEAEG
jgi:hypothetical protein